MTTFSVGEEVLFRGERYVIAGKTEEQPQRFRLLASSPEGTKVIWTSLSELHKVETYTRPRDDTTSY